MKNCLFVSYIMLEKQANVTFSNDTLPAIQTLKFAKSMLRMLGMSFDNVRTVGFCPIQDYPKGNKVFFGYNTGFVESFECRTLPFFNLLGLKHISRFINLIIYCTIFLIKNRNTTVIFHGLHSPYLLVGIILKFFSVKVGVVVTDESSLPVEEDSKIKSILKKIDSFIINIMISKFDYGLALSEGLKNKYFKRIECFVFPGVVDNEFSLNYIKNNVSLEECDYLKVFYGGILSAEYGIDKLIDAMLLIDWPIQLCCFGRGDQVERLSLLSKSDSRFFYGGFVSQDHLIGAMRNSDILINVRPSSTRLAKMSFPSKLLEYASTGKAVLTTKLPSIPHNIADGFFYIDDESVLGISESIGSINKVGKEVMANKGNFLRHVVLENYSDENISKRFSIFLRNNK